MGRIITLSFVALLSAAVPALANDAFVGEWINVDDKTNDLTRIKIAKTDDGWTIQAWGAARGAEVDLGAVSLTLLADTARPGAEMKYGYASWDHKFADMYLTLRLEKPWLISVEDFNIFKDNSGRSNYRMRSEFKRVQEKETID